MHSNVTIHPLLQIVCFFFLFFILSVVCHQDDYYNPRFPQFIVKNNTELRTQVGSTVVLHCAADFVGEHTVSWIRRKDYHLLTIGSQLHTSDERFQVRYIEVDSDWQLHIRYVQVRDDGDYECQISSHPPISLFATLRVLETSSEILGGPEKYMTIGSSLRLVCVLKDYTQPPTFVFWYHDDLMINYQKTREVKVENEAATSVLSINDVRSSDSGNYTCSPSNARPAHINIHVLRVGEMPAAIHSGVTTRRGFDIHVSWMFCILLHLTTTKLLAKSLTWYIYPTPLSVDSRLNSMEFFFVTNDRNFVIEK